jgi:PBP1b-binding outer membrane lipoprotein LpoB
MKLIKQLSVLFLVALLLTACSGDKDNRSVQAYASAFVNANDKVILYGNIDLKSILNKADYASVPKFGGILKGELKNIESGLNLDQGIYYAVEGPFEKGNLGAVYLFAEIKNSDSLKLQLTQRGYDLDNAGGIDYFRSGDVGFGIKGKLALMMVKSGKFDTKELISAAIKNAGGDLLEGTAATILAEKSDISINLHMYNNYKTNSELYGTVAKDKMKQLDEMMKGSFSQANVFFENGQLRVAMKNHLSVSLKKRMMMLNDDKATIRQSIGQGEPKMAISTNLDMTKLQTWMDDYAPGAMDKLMEAVPQLQMAMMVAGGKLSNLMDGKIGFAMYGEPKAGAMVPDFSFYVGFGPQGKSLAEMAQNFLSGGTMKLAISDNGLQGSSSDAYKSVVGNSISVPSGCETFGKTAFSGYANLEEMDTKAFEFKGGAKMIELVKYLNFSFDTEGGEILVKLKELNTNVLKQASEFMLGEFESQISAMNP